MTKSPVLPLSLKTEIRSNRILAALPDVVAQRILPLLQLVDMPLGMVIYEPGVKFSHAYFPVDCVVSIEFILRDGNSAKVCVVGNDGIVGISSFLGGNTAMPSRAFVYCAGSAYRIQASSLVEEFRRHGELLAVILRYMKTVIVQLSQISVCNRYHGIDEQLGRFLLMTLDKLPSNCLSITQELIGSMLGVRRESVTKACQKLRDEGAIRQTRGKITVLDRPLVEDLSCECYQVIKVATDDLLPHTT